MKSLKRVDVYRESTAWTSRIYGSNLAIRLTKITVVNTNDVTLVNKPIKHSSMAKTQPAQHRLAAPVVWMTNDKDLTHCKHPLLLIFSFMPTQQHGGYTAIHTHTHTPNFSFWFLSACDATLPPHYRQESLWPLLRTGYNIFLIIQGEASVGLTGAAPAPPVVCFDERYSSLWQEASTIKRFESLVHALTFLFLTRADRERFWLIFIGWLDAPTSDEIFHRERRRKNLFWLTSLRVLSYGINLTDLGAWKMTTKVSDCLRKSVCWQSIKQSTATLSFYQINRSINS